MLFHSWSIVRCRYVNHKSIILTFHFSFRFFNSKSSARFPGNLPRLSKTFLCKMSESIFSVHKFLLRKYIYTKPQNIKLKNFWHTVSSSARHWIRFNEKLMTPECNKIKSIRSFSLSDPRSHLPWEIWGLRCEKRCSHWASHRAACCRLWSSLLPGGNRRRRSSRTWIVICLIQSVFVVCMNNESEI